MHQEDIIRIVSEYIVNSNYNYISEKDAIAAELAGMKMFDEPV